MRFVFRNFYILVFACFSLFSAVWVATGPERTERIARPLVKDAREIEALATGAYRELRDFQWRAAYDEFVTLYVAAMRMPSLMFEKLAERLDKVNDDISERTRYAPNPSLEVGEGGHLAFHQARASASAMP